MKYGLIGERLSHSFSREIHGCIADYEYELCEVPRDELDHFMRVRNFRGINVTIPYKEAVIPCLDEVSEHALAIGSVNTVVNVGGVLFGYNTDFLGALYMLKHAKIELSGKKVLILGTGGTSKTAAYVGAGEGASEIVTVSRSGKDGAVTYSEAYEKHGDAEVIINTTPCGMFPGNDDCPIDIDRFPLLCGVADVIYNPLETRLVRQARARGIRATGGLYMLAAQAVYASAKFRGTNPDEAETERVYNEVRRRKTNIVLCGMPSCGKSTVGKIISSMLGRDFVDTDALIVERAGREIREIFENDGEEAFRSLEREVISSVSRMSGAVISLGGGAILDAANVDALRQNGEIVFLDRPIDMLMATADRPLSSDRDALVKLYEKRYPIYLSVADKTATASGTPDEVAAKILEEF